MEQMENSQWGGLVKYSIKVRFCNKEGIVQQRGNVTVNWNYKNNKERKNVVIKINCVLCGDSSV